MEYEINKDPLLRFMGLIGMDNSLDTHLSIWDMRRQDTEVLLYKCLLVQGRYVISVELNTMYEYQLIKFSISYNMEQLIKKVSYNQYIHVIDHLQVNNISCKLVGYIIQIDMNINIIRHTNKWCHPHV